MNVDRGFVYKARHLFLFFISFTSFGAPVRSEKTHGTVAELTWLAWSYSTGSWRLRRAGRRFYNRRASAVDAGGWTRPTLTDIRCSQTCENNVCLHGNSTNVKTTYSSFCTVPLVGAVVCFSNETTDQRKTCSQYWRWKYAWSIYEKFHLDSCCLFHEVSILTFKKKKMCKQP